MQHVRIEDHPRRHLQGGSARLRAGDRRDDLPRALEPGPRRADRGDHRHAAVGLRGCAPAVALPAGARGHTRAADRGGRSGGSGGADRAGVHPRGRPLRPGPADDQRIAHSPAGTADRLLAGPHHQPGSALRQQLHAQPVQAARSRRIGRRERRGRRRRGRRGSAHLALHGNPPRAAPERADPAVPDAEAPARPPHLDSAADGLPGLAARAVRRDDRARRTHLHRARAGRPQLRGVLRRVHRGGDDRPVLRRAGQLDSPRSSTR